MTSTTAELGTTSTHRGAGPLTTVFTTPDFCASSAWSNYATPALSSSICMPNGFTTYWNYEFYSPGICPESYTSGCAFPTAAATVSDGTSFLGGPLEDGESAIICCPAGYTCMSSPSTDSYLYSKCVATTESVYTLALPTTVTWSTTPLVYAIQVRWKTSDLNVLETNPTKSGETITPTATSASATAAATSTQSTGAAASSSSSSTSSSSDSDDTIPTGAKIGLGVGIGVAAVVLGILAYLVWRRKSANRQQLASTSTGGEHDNSEIGGCGGMAMKGGFSELQDTSTNREATPGGLSELATPDGGTWNSSTWGGSTMLVSPLTPRPGTATTAAGEGAVEMEASGGRHELAGHVTDLVEMPASNQFVAELPGDTPVQHREKWS